LPKNKEIALSRKLFPKEFVWGAATAAYQIEGAVNKDGRSPSIWDVFSHTPGKTFQGETGDIAADHYHRYKEDVKLMRELGLNGYRFSISWPRIIPEGKGAVNSKGLDFYDKLVDELLANGIEPFVTLYHWDLPQVLQEQGGWKERATSQIFVEYADVVTRRLGDRVKAWITLNEPWVSAVTGHITGEHAPGETDIIAGVRVGHHLMLAHGLALPVIRQNMTRKDAEVGITLSTTYVEPGDDSTEAKDLALLVDVISNRLFLDPIFKGHYPKELPENFLLPMLPLEPGDLEIISRPVDFLGINYYFRTLPLNVEDFTTYKIRQYQPPESQFTAMGWEVYPDGLYQILKRVHQEYFPGKLYITENGAAFEDVLEESSSGPVVHDAERQEYLSQHLQAALKAVQKEIPLAGYFAWTLYDNFEWAFGTDKRFGLVYLDYPTQRRIIKDSGRWYSRFLQG
jgi:beta-glucosidase